MKLSGNQFSQYGGFFYVLVTHVEFDKEPMTGLDAKGEPMAPGQ